MYNRAFTPERISELKENEIFVFGSNLVGAHGGGAALAAYHKFGAVWGRGVELCNSNHARRRRDHPSVCRRIYPFRP